jgi:hypothetical protein
MEFFRILEAGTSTSLLPLRVALIDPIRKPLGQYALALRALLQ